MATIKDLYDAIKKTDVAKSPFEGVSYDLTYNDLLGLPKGDPKASSYDGNFTVLSPFPTIPKEKEDKTLETFAYDGGKMPIEQTFKAVIREGIKLSTEQNTLFIDMTDLDQNSSAFFTEGGKESIAQAIADQLNDKSLANVKPVVRFLRGTPDQTSDAKFWNSRQSTFASMFWQKDEHGNIVPLIHNDKAELHIGFYSPSLGLPKRQEDAIRGMLSWALKLTAGYGLKESNAMLDTLFNNVTFSASWNHGKIVAVGGKTMMTGGINYWNEYTAPQTKILDMQAKVTGDAAISAHGYADYFWKYLNKAHDTDSRSFKKSIKLTTPFDQVASAWQSDTVVPIFKDTVKLTPKNSGIQVLSIARLGDWHGNYISEYPVQFVDGLRDILVNVNAPAAVAAGDFKGLVRQIQTSGDAEGIMGVLRGFNFSPAAWASRTARVKAIANAKTSVYMSNQMIVGGLQKGNASYDIAVKTLNEGKAKNQIWDGYLWPYDLLLALANLVIKWRNSDNSKIGGIQIVLSGKDADWGDQRTVRDLFDKVIPLVQGLDPSINKEAADELVRKWMLVRRIGSRFGPNSIHTKTVCVDEQLLYVGSDNLYPSYNEEHGIWVDDKAALSDWVENFWKAMWSKLDVPDVADYHASPNPA